MNENTEAATRVVVVGAGMVAHRFVESVLSNAEGAVHITVIGDEGRHPYDRVGLTGYFSGATPTELTLDRAVFDDERVALIADDRVVRIDRRTQTVVTRARQAIAYDTLVLATGSYAARVAVDGADLPGCFVYRTLDDVQELRRFVQHRSAELGRPLRGAVIGGGLLGLEAAGALQGLEVDCTVVQSSDRLMSAQLDLAGGGMLRRLIEARGIS
ncbi:MAG: FAD-dependent oxidoreductase, partial [Actinomycetota bacterium]